MNKKLGFVFAALLFVPAALLGQEKAPAQSTPPANPITASEKGFYSFVSGAVVVPYLIVWIATVCDLPLSPELWQFVGLASPAMIIVAMPKNAFTLAPAPMVKK